MINEMYQQTQNTQILSTDIRNTMNIYSSPIRSGYILPGGYGPTLVYDVAFSHDIIQFDSSLIRTGDELLYSLDNRSQRQHLSPPPIQATGFGQTDDFLSGRIGFISLTLLEIEPQLSSARKVDREQLLENSGAIQQHESAHTDSLASTIARLSGLEIAELAALMGVSRTTYYNWISGAKPRLSRFERLAQLNQIVLIAQETFGTVQNVRHWFMTPMLEEVKTPYQYLCENNYYAVKGFLLKARMKKTLLKPLLERPRFTRTLSREEYQDARDNLRTQFRIDEK